jgi:hypothetical protein
MSEQVSSTRMVPLERPSLGRTSVVLGIVALVGTVIPPGLFLAPMAGVAGIGLGSVAMIRGEGNSGKADAALLGVTLSALGLLASSFIIFVFRHVIWRIAGHAAQDAQLALAPMSPSRPPT